MTTLEILERLAEVTGESARLSGRSYNTKCPAHDDRNASLSVTAAPGRTLLHCHAGCSKPDICAALGITLADLFENDRSGNRRPAPRLPARHRERVEGDQKRPPQAPAPRARIVKTYDYVSAAGVLLFQEVRKDPKSFYQRRPDGRGGWINKLAPETPRVLYRLPEVVAAVTAGAPIYVVEGEKDADSVVAAGAVATCNPGGAGPGKWRPEHTEALRGATRVNVVADRDEPGRRHARAIADALRGLVDDVVVLEPIEGKDVSDHLAAGHKLEELRPTLTAVPAPPSAPAGPSARSRRPERSDGSFGAVLDAVEALIGRYVMCSDEQRVVLAVWVAHTYVLRSFYATPYMHVISAEPGSGKTQLLEVLAALVRNAEMAGDFSPAVLYRIIDDQEDGYPPTLLIDETDTVFGSSGRGEASDRAEALRGIINTGYKRSGRTVRCEGPKHTIRRFSTYAAKALAGLKPLPSTIRDRSIPITLRKMRGDEGIADWNGEVLEGKEAPPITMALAGWSEKAAGRLQQQRPPMPPGLNPRQREIWTPLVAIAADAGGSWPTRLRAAARVLSRVEVDEASLGVQLLSDIRLCFGDRDRFGSTMLIAALAELEESPWGTWTRDDKPISVKKFASLLKPFGITSEEWQDAGKHVRGYWREAFVDPWSRYLQAESDTQSGRSGRTRMVEPKTATSDPGETAESSRIENAQKRLEQADPPGFPDRIPDPGDTPDVTTSALSRVHELATKTADIIAPTGYGGMGLDWWASFVEGCVSDVKRGGEPAALAVLQMESVYSSATNGGAS